jgi:hypothetical protein
MNSILLTELIGKYITHKNMRGMGNIKFLNHLFY